MKPFVDAPMVSNCEACYQMKPEIVCIDERAPFDEDMFICMDCQKEFDSGRRTPPQLKVQPPLQAVPTPFPTPKKQSTERTLLASKQTEPLALQGAAADSGWTSVEEAHDAEGEGASKQTEPLALQGAPVASGWISVEEALDAEGEGCPCSLSSVATSDPRSSVASAKVAWLLPIQYVVLFPPPSDDGVEVESDEEADEAAGECYQLAPTLTLSPGKCALTTSLNLTSRAHVRWKRGGG